MENTGDYFVMLNLQGGGIEPMTYKTTNDLAMFETKEQAEASAKDNLLGDMFGYEVFCRGYGE